VPDYWIVNLVESRLEVYRAPAATAPFGWRYHAMEIPGPSHYVAALVRPDAVIRVADLLP
jgi:hypothetical protein